MATSPSSYIPGTMLSTPSASRRSSVISEVRAILYCTKGAGINTRMVRLHPTMGAYFQVCNGLDLLDQKGVSAAFAREMFILSNDPSMQEVREKLWAHRSLSVGDVVEIDFCTGTTMVCICLGCGWHIVDKIGEIEFKEGEFVKLDTIEVLERLEAAGGFFQREDVILGIQPTES